MRVPRAFSRPSRTSITCAPRPHRVAVVTSSDAGRRRCSGRGRWMPPSCWSAKRRETRRTGLGTRSSDPPAGCSARASSERGSTPRACTRPTPSSTSSGRAGASVASTRRRRGGRWRPAGRGSRPSWTRSRPRWWCSSARSPGRPSSARLSRHPRARPRPRRPRGRGHPCDRASILDPARARRPPQA